MPPYMPQLPRFDLKFAGGGGFYGTPTHNGDFANYYMVVAYNSTPCPRFTSNSTQVIEWRGNGASTFSGTVLAPSACLDLLVMPTNRQCTAR